MKISLLLPKGTSVTKTREFIRKEIGSSRNIKSKQTRDSVESSLNKINQYLNKINSIDKGIALFCDDKLTIKEYLRNEKKYFCGKDFLDISYRETKGDCVLVTLDANECTIGLVSNYMKVLWTEQSTVPRKQDAGGQSELRYEKNRQLALVHWLKRCSDMLKKLVKNRKLIIGGPGPVKKEFLNYFKYDKIIAIKDIGNTDEQGLKELFDKSLKDIKDNELMEIKLIVDDFAKRLAKGDKLIDYGFSTLDVNNVERVIVDKEFVDKVPKGIPTVVVENNRIIKGLQIGIIKRWHNEQRNN